jgi:hypothetical protein
MAHRDMAFALFTNGGGDCVLLGLCTETMVCMATDDGPSQ